jgi:hypothetical protein
VPRALCGDFSARAEPSGLLAAGDTQVLAGLLTLGPGSWAPHTAQQTIFGATRTATLPCALGGSGGGEPQGGVSLRAHSAGSVVSLRERG